MSVYKGDELLANFREQRGLGVVTAQEITHQFVPVLRSINRFQHRKILAQQGADVVEYQPTINRHATIFDTGWRRIGLWIAQVHGESMLDLLKPGRVSAVHAEMSWLRIGLQADKSMSSAVTDGGQSFFGVVLVALLDGCDVVNLIHQLMHWRKVEIALQQCWKHSE
jgi:hypothetical protein